ncbi:MAG: 2-amino-4-hydroxy-6-hydroxymethyldihydropteridine diphosphokinase [Porticoccaceae bacterium]|nr:MAG: 2-amino-4-hydroxy-6-hydroxymethyldihydropteridine diphosphokinase [Porticoccaceae bacterium]
MPVAYVALGSNLADPPQQLARALSALAQLPATHLAAVSRRYRSEPWGPVPQPPYLNAVAKLITAFEPAPLLAALQGIESAQGRVRAERFGPRTLDLDLLLYDRLELSTPELTLPHPRLGERPFVLYPLAELDPELVLPDGTPLAALLRRVPPRGIALAEIDKIPWPS